MAFSELSPAEVGRRLRVLVVDDHLVNRMVAAVILEALDAEIVPVEDGIEAVHRFQAERFDLVLMDLHMPVMDGLSAIRALRAIENERGLGRTAIHVVSTDALPHHRRRSVEAGADGHLPKPVAAAALLKLAKDLMLEAKASTDSAWLFGPPVGSRARDY